MADEKHEGQTWTESEEEVDNVVPDIVYFANNGDLRLRVFEATLFGKARHKIYVVSSHAMSLACDAWNSMLNGPFKESQASPPGEQREVALPDDNPAALEILLNIAHLRFELVPETLSFSALFRVTLLTDKYDATRLIRPWATSWINASRHLALEPGHGEWLWIAWELGQKSTFADLTQHLVRTARLDQDGNCKLVPSARILDPCETPYDHLPPGIIESIMSVRQRVIADLLEVYYSSLDELVTNSMKGSTVCQGPPGTSEKKFRECDDMTFGSLSLSLQRVGLDIKREDTSTVTKSVNELLVSLRGLTINVYHAKVNGLFSYQCQNYKLNSLLLHAVDQVEKSIPSAVLDIHHRHLKRQAEKLGYE